MFLSHLSLFSDSFLNYLQLQKNSGTGAQPLTESTTTAASGTANLLDGLF